MSAPRRGPGGNAVPPHLRADPEGQTPTPSVIDLIDHTLLRADATPDAIDTLCREAAEYGFASVCVNPQWVARSAENLRHSSPRVCTVIGFPLGAMHPAIKAEEARTAVAAGAHEVDMVMAIGAFKSADDDAVRRDIAGVRRAVGRAITLKVILETGFLSPEEIVRASTIAVAAETDFVKTSTGFGPGGATVEAVRAMHDAVGGRAEVKASGGIRTLADARAMVAAGAARLGCSSGAAIAAEEGAAGAPAVPGIGGQTRCESAY